MTMKLKKGFTLVELVVVIAVIVILSAILIPTFANVTQKANEAAKVAALKGAKEDLLTEYYDLDESNLIFEYKGKYYKNVQNEDGDAWEEMEETTLPEGAEQLVVAKEAEDGVTENIKYLKDNVTDTTILSSYSDTKATNETKYLLTETFNKLKVYKK